MKKKRDYQARAESGILKEWESVTSTLCVMPTGTGKSFVASNLIQKCYPLRAMVVAHRKELITQMYNSINEIMGDVTQCEIEMSSQYASHHHQSNRPVVAMVQSLNSKNGLYRRMDRFDPNSFGLLIIDEAHRGVADSYKEIISFFKRNPKLKILGLTATPDRLDEKALGEICETVAFDYEIIDAINDGWLVPIDQVMVPIKGLDFSHVRTVAGDLNQSDLAAIMEAEEVIQRIVQPTLEFMFSLPQHCLDEVEVPKWGEFILATGEKPRRTLVFTVTVHQAEMLSNIFNRVVDGLFDWVCGATPDTLRAEKLAQFDRGQIAGMVNVGCLTEGYDCPAVEIIVQARPTKSRAFYSQTCGRGTRTLPGVVDGCANAEERKAAIAASAKPRVLVIDFVGNSGKHKLMSAADILGGKSSDAAIERSRKFAQKLGRPVRMSQVLEDSEEEIKEEMERVRQRRLAEEAHKSKVVARVSYTTRFVDPFDILDITPARSRGWDEGKVLTPKQKAVLVRQGINPDSLTFAQGKQLLIEIFKRFDQKQCSIPQANLLKRYNLPTDVSREQASKWLDELKSNYWKKPKSMMEPRQANILTV